MSGRVELLIGPAGSGKTAHLLSRYRQALREEMHQQVAGGTLWLTPTSRSRRALLANLPNASLPVCFAPNVFTFDKFAERVLESSGQPLRPLSEPARRLLVSRLVQELLEEGGIEYFQPIARTAGFVDLLLAFIAELKRNEIWPDHFVAACEARDRVSMQSDIPGRGNRSHAQKDRELARIYERYQETLNRHGLYDAEGCFWSARNILKEGGRGPFERLSLVVVDGFADFTHTQYEILDHLAGWGDRLMISLPGEESNRSASLARQDLFAKSVAAKDRLKATFGDRLSIVPSNVMEPAADRSESLRHLADSLFVNPRVASRSDDACGIEVLAVTGQVGEVRAVAERVKRLLMEGVGPDEIVVAVRSLEDYADLVEETFGEAGIPYVCPPAGSFAQAPVLRALISVLLLELENWPFDRLKSLLLSNYFRPSDAGEHGRERLVGAVSALRHLGLASGQAAYLKGLERIAQLDGEGAETENDASRNGSEDDNPDRADVDDTDSRAQRARHAREAQRLLQGIATATERLRSQAPFGNWVERLIGLADDLGLSPRSSHRRFESGGANGSDESADLVEKDRTVWRHFERMLFDAAETLRHIGDQQQPLSLAEFTSQLQDLLRIRRLPVDGLETGRVRVMESSDVRNLEILYLFLAGLTESSFPRSRHDDCLYHEVERRTLNEHGLSLAHRSAHSQDEMLLFYQIVTRARRQLTLSYPSVSSAGLPLFPSPYLVAVRDLFEPHALKIESVGDLDPVPAASEMLTPADLRLVATDEVRANRPGLFRTLCEQPFTERTGRNILATVDTAVARFHSRGFTEYEGRLPQSVFTDQLLSRFPANYQFSATQLEQYAFCPFRFFLSNVLGIAPLESVQAATDYLGRGVMVHKVLAEMHRPGGDDEANEEHGATEAGTIVERFRDLVDRELNRRVGDSELQVALREIERQLLHDWGEAYGDQWEAYRAAFAEIWQTSPHTRHVETGFGNAPGEEGDSVDIKLASLVFGTGESQTRVRGRIDRVDVGEIESHAVFNVVDYKTGLPPRFDFKDIESGRSLQLALYTVAVMRHELAGRGAVPFQMGYWSLRETGYVSGLKGGRSKSPERLTPEAVEQLEQTLEELVPRLAAGIRSGEFPVASLDDDCTGRCPYSTVCRVNQIRPLEETLDKRRSASIPKAAED